MFLKQKFDLALIDISLTVFGDEAGVVSVLNMEADDYIVKPFRPRELVAHVCDLFFEWSCRLEIPF